MKRTILKSIFLGAAVLFGMTSCDDWLDVSPKSQIKEEDHFSREGGFIDQLTGVYTQMISPSMYGLQMGVGFVEVLSQNYDVNVNGTWRYAAEYDYKESGCEAIINNIWSKSYNCIANLNLVLQNIDKVDRDIFTDNNYFICKGEALGLRAFLHFDLMRLFACAPAMNSQAKAVPYVTEYSTDVVTQKSVDETMKLVINDLLDARECFENDSIKSSYSPYFHRSQRISHFNYYAAVATLARAYLWMGDTQNALTYANEIIETVESDAHSKPFDWEWSSSMDCLFTDEQVMRLDMNEWDDVSDAYFMSQAGANVLSPSEIKVNEIYETAKGYGGDPRMLNGYTREGGDYYMSKFALSAGSTYMGYPLIRINEAYYIAAECLKESDPLRAIELLNKVRLHRQIYDYLSETLTADEIQEEIYKEYRKEYVGEGQLFYYYKRLNAPEIVGAPIRADKSVYVLPIPSSDVEFGGYQN